MRRAILALALMTAGCASQPAHHHATAKYEARPFHEVRNAMAAVDAALARAALSGRHVLLVMGANWCHDSRGLAGLFETQRFADWIGTNYELVYVDAGKPREDAANNMAVAKRFGVERLVGTPNVFVLSSEGVLLNDAENVTGWTDAASRDEDEIFDFLVAMAPGH